MEPSGLSAKPKYYLKGPQDGSYSTDLRILIPALIGTVQVDRVLQHLRLGPLQSRVLSDRDMGG